MISDLREKYFQWMCRICDGNRPRKVSYERLLRYLYAREFIVLVPMDENRAKDGIDLRYRFAYDNGLSKIEVKMLDCTPCSVLEMMVALAVRCEEHIMNNDDAGDRTGLWFWKMIDNLDLSRDYNSKFNEAYVDKVITRLLYREYSPDGEGGSFTVPNAREDMRKVEIAHQMFWYLNDYINEEGE